MCIAWELGEKDHFKRHDYWPKEWSSLCENHSTIGAIFEKRLCDVQMTPLEAEYQYIPYVR
jgi:hypothetical protein